MARKAKSPWPKRYRTVSQLVDAIRADEVADSVVSPGAAADALGVTRQAVHDRIRRGALHAWCAEGVVLVDAKQVRSEVRRRRGIAETQGELLNATT
jgi:4-alpha-glucanotransferase